MLTLKIVSHSGNEILKEITNPEFKRNENTIYFTDQKGESDRLTLSEGETSSSHDTAYVMNESGATVSTWHYKASLAKCGGGIHQHTSIPRASRSR
ncbi:hypothetical protein ACN0JD_002475 [Yersinia enterocolitica]|nr:hypothetical protein [Yersinia enterocolitica]ELI8163006.1 hypothetical protein [Yersinia enterocolitica]HEB2009534.1 hypothetical protein [Yersinia enterocolitica]HEG1705807.1 hypothetical protein [Yersinia enterocolitica]HEN3465045.1 hypothetical protein [Yersinia enterocolitica]